MSELQVLRTAKSAQDEGLISQDDFDVIKVAFLKAQQIRAGLEAGFIRKDNPGPTGLSFLQSLDFPVEIAYCAPIAVVSQPRAPLVSSASERVLKARSFSLKPTRSGPGPLVSNGSVPNSETSVPAINGTVADPQPFTKSVRANGSNDGSSRGAKAYIDSGNASGLRPEVLVQLPIDIPKTAKGSQTMGKKSMSGIGVHEDAVNLYHLIKTRSTYQWVTYKIDEGGSQVVIEHVGIKGSAYPDFLSALPERHCRFGVFDFTFVKEEGMVIHKLVFIFWAPEGANVKSKMTYASTKEFVKGFMDGIGADLQGSDMEEVDVEAVKAKIHQGLTRK